MRRLKAKIAMLLAISAGTSLLISCEGRKMTNMEPTGETVDVVIEQPADTAPSDSSTDQQ